jgi:hypothetical protein
LVKSEFFKSKLEDVLESYGNESATLHALLCDTFLAHSSDDIDLVQRIIVYFRACGAKPYIDKDDMELPINTSSKTASTLIHNIEACSKFVVVVTDKSINSKWVPWELGVANSQKAYKDVAILPIDSLIVNGNWKNNEYLGIYQQIREKNGELIVYNPEDKTTLCIHEWLRI